MVVGEPMSKVNPNVDRLTHKVDSWSIESPRNTDMWTSSQKSESKRLKYFR